MKPYLPYNILLMLTVVCCGFVILYNTVIRESYVTTLRYSYPVIEEPQPEQEIITWERIYPEEGPSEEAGNSVPDENAVEEPESVTSVRFPLDINAATVEQLKFIPQVGDVMSRRIIQYRESIGGRFTDLEQLKNISGIGDATYERLWAYFYIGDGSGGEPYNGQEDGADGIVYIEVPEDLDE